MTGYPTTVAQSVDAWDDRIIVGGRDITWFRYQPTPAPEYELMEPFGYGSATLTIPQVRPYLEAAAFGDPGELRWVRKGAVVKIERHQPGNPFNSVRDYLGVVVAIKAQGPDLVLVVGGLLAGQAQLRNKQTPVYRKVKDIGRWVHDSVDNAGFIGCSFTPRLGPETGIELAETGGMTWLAWLQHLGAMSTKKDGTQRAIMPATWGTGEFHFPVKDTSTVHATVWLDGTSVVPDLTSDAAEAPNVWYASGVTDQGMMWDGTVFPLVEPGTPPAYPGTLTQGMTGSDVLTLNWKLLRARLLTRKETEWEIDDFDAETTEAVEDLQRRAGLPVTGVVNKKTWDALFDVNVIGWSLAGARIEPLWQDDNVRSWNYSGNGTLLGKNTGKVEGVLRSERNVDFGAGITRKDGRRWVKGQATRLAGKSWTGTITLNDCAAWTGQHTTPTGLTAGDILPARNLRPGMNLWLANFDGGTLVHVANIRRNGRATTLMVDTHARDSLELGAIVARNRESRRNHRREFILEQRGSTKIPDALMPFHEDAGVLYTNVDLAANTWGEFPLFVGEAGTVSKLRLELTVPTEFCMFIVNDQLPGGVKGANRRIGNPFPVDADGETVWTNPNLADWYRDRLLLYSAGNEDQPCGYWPKKHTNANGETTSAPLTGVWQADASFGYHTGEVPALWVYVYPKNATAAKRGRVVWAQMNPAV